ncbi:MAG: hypothetical protein KJZ47_05150 [Gemmatimonadales bacterium]|nr:hypothetical protein [Gemmatimonadales bacterium]
MRRTLWRAAMWLLVGLATYWLVVTLRAVQAGERDGLASGLVWAGTCLALAGWIGIRNVRERTQAQESSTGSAAQMLLLAELGRQDDATLERMARAPGPASEAARMILQGRHLGNPGGTQRHPPPESR